MRAYQLYIIEEEFASHYFGRERMFFELFQQFQESTGDMRSILLKQIMYITKPIPESKIQQFINQHLKYKKGDQIDQKSFYIESGKRSKAKLKVLDRFLTLEASGNYDAETEFFEVLRKSEPYFLAIDYQHLRYGWLKPIKERKFV